MATNPPFDLAERTFRFACAIVRFCRKKEARASRLWLRLIEAEGLAPLDEVRPLLNEANELVAIFTTSVKRLRLTVTA